MNERHIHKDNHALTKLKMFRQYLLETKMKLVN